jgi:flagellin-like protein
MRGVSAVIATILLLMITVALAATSYVWFSSVTSGVTSAGSNVTQKAVTGLLSEMNVESATPGMIYVRNTGDSVLDGFALYMNGVAVNITVNPSSLSPTQVATITLPGKYSGTGSNTILITTAQGARVTTSNTILFWDDFEDGSLAGWTNYTYPGNLTCNISIINSTQYDGTTGKVLNETCIAGAQTEMSTGDSSWKDYTVEAYVNRSVQSDSNWREAWVMSYYNSTVGATYRCGTAGTNSSMWLYLQQFPGSVVSISKAYTLNDNKWYKFTLSVQGSSLKCYVNDVLELSATTTSPLTSGLAGVTTYKSTGSFTTFARFDNMKVYK